MASFNKVILMGNLTRDPELRYTGSGSAVCTIGLAMNKTYKTQSGELREEPCFVDVTIWGKQAESCNEYLNKGANILVEGELKQESWVDSTTGQKKYKLSVTANNIRFLGEPKNKNSQEQGAPPAPQYQAPHTPGAPESTSYSNTGMPPIMPQS